MRRVFLLAIALAWAVPSLAESTDQQIQLQPGSTITVTPGVETTIACLAGAAATQVMCTCQYESPRWYVVQVSPLTAKVIGYLASGDTLGECRTKLGADPLCK